METVSRILLTFLLNALWQIPIVCAIAALACRFMADGPARHRHTVWVTALLAAVLLPLASVRTPTPGASLPLATPEIARAIASAPAAAASPAGAPLPSPVPRGRTVSFAETTAAIMLGAYLLFVLFRVARLAIASFRTARIRQTANAGAAPVLVEDVWSRCLAAFGLRDVELLCSGQVSGPVTAGRAIILPGSLLAETSHDVLTTAIGHEMAHIARRDFAFNLLYELLYLPVSFHPAAWLIHRSIERTREMSCDELVTHRLLDAAVYARSIMTIATAMTALPRPGYSLGVFDGDILEERIRRLLERPATNLKRARLLLAAGLGALVVCAVAASTLALTARAQGGGYAAMKQAEAAYNRGDYESAARQFESAVKLEPANIKAKLFLAQALFQQVAPGQTAADSPVVAAARQQYYDVLARDAHNVPALEGLMMLALNTKQSAEAHDWALKVIAADPNNTTAYYSAGFTDWSLAYPDYTRARAAAGMRPEDPGIIPDANLRKSVRDQHQARIEDGFRMLQIALQRDPNYSDAMAYMNLLYRIEAGIADTPEESADMIAKADVWVDRAMAAIQQRAQTRKSTASRRLDVDGPASGPAAAGVIMAPAPPPPPPPPGWQGDLKAMVSGAPPSQPRAANRAEQSKPFWQVVGRTEMPANTLVQQLAAKGFQPRLLAGQDQLLRVIVGPYPEESLDQAKADLEAAGFRPVRVW